MLQEHIAIAERAKNYARAQIREGSSQLQNNFYDAYKRKALKKALLDVRAAVAAKEKGIIAKIDITLQKFEQTVSLSTKFSLGNCYEYALIALYFILTYTSKIQAEVFYILGGDHVLLVIGRKAGSIPSIPETWGADACICDPWSDVVYPAADYLKKTKNFYQVATEDGSYTNHIEDFNPAKHKLDLHTNLNTTYLRKHAAEANSILMDVFSNLNQRCMTIYNKLAHDLEVLAEQIERHYGSHDFKVAVLKEKIKELRTATSSIKTHFDDFIKKIKENKQNSYVSYKDLNNEMVRQTVRDVMTLRKIGLMPAKLDEHRCPFTLIRLIMEFLNIRPKSSQEYSKALQSSEELVSEFARSFTFL